MAENVTDKIKYLSAHSKPKGGTLTTEQLFINALVKGERGKQHLQLI
jgi:hypothetical protein